MTEEVKKVEETLEQAVKAAKEFHPIKKMYVNGYTGEVSQYKTPDNYVPDEGLSCGKPDLCHTEDHVSIAQMYARLKAMRALSLQDSDFDFYEDKVSADDLDEDTLSDVVMEIDDPSDYENIVEPWLEQKKDLSAEVVNNIDGEEKAQESMKDEEATSGADEE